MLIYLLKFSSCLAIFMAFYKLFLERENMHHIKRYYLLVVLVLSISIPLVIFTEYIEPVLSNVTFTETAQLPFDTEIIAQPTLLDYLPQILWSIYGLGALFFGLKFVLNLTSIVNKIKQNPKLKSNSFITVLLSDTITPHTFFSYIFLNKHKFETQQIPKEVFIHEQTHAKQKHSLDILFIEFLQIIFWFHPLVYLLKKDIKLNHEFLADYAVLKEGIKLSTYQQILLAFSSNATEPQLANAINYSSIKKRFTIMKTHTSKQKIWFRSLLLLPLIALTLYGFSNKEIIERVDPPAELNEIYQRIQDGASTEEVEEYNKLAKHYNAQPKEKRIVKLKDLNRLEVIYKKMTTKQKESAEPFPDCPPQPSPEAPKVKKGELSNIPPPPPPPPISGDATKEQKAKYEKTQKEYDKLYEIKNGEVIKRPPPPPPPKSPLDHTIDMAKKGASFYYEGKSISSDEAINLLKKNEKLNISTKDSNSKQPRVYITNEPIKLENKKTGAKFNQDKLLNKSETTYLKIDAESLNELKTIDWNSFNEIFIENDPTTLVTLEVNYNQKVNFKNTEINSFNFKASNKTSELTTMINKAKKVISLLN